MEIPKGELSLEIDRKSEDAIQKSFDKIAKDLMTNWALRIQGRDYSIIEIEFYFHCENHKDQTTYELDAPAGFWKPHYSGIDISLRNTHEEGEGYGGILIRGIKSANGSINGPLRVKDEIFKQFGKSTELSKEFGLSAINGSATFPKISRTKRHGLRTHLDSELRDKPYRYYHSLEEWNDEKYKKRTDLLDTTNHTILL